MSSSLAIVEKRPSPFPGGGGGCAGGVLFHLLDWHRRLARKRRLFSPRRLLPSSLRSAPRRLPCPGPPAPPPPPAAPRPSTADDGSAAPGVVARLMGLESWPAAAPPRPQKQRKVEASRPPDGGGGDSAVVLVLPTSRSRRHPSAPAPAPVPTTTARSHHGADLPARSPRRTRLVHAAAAKLLDQSARASSRASARLALAYACSSPQHRKDGGHSGALLQGSGTADDFLSRSESVLTPPARVQVQSPTPPAEMDCDSAAVSRRHEHHRSISNANAEISASTVVLPRMDFADGNIGKHSFDMGVKHKESRVRNEVMRTCARVRSSAAAVQTGAERLRKRATPARPDASGTVNSGGIADSMRPVGRSREFVSAGRRATQKQNCSGPRREVMGSITGQGSTTRRDVVNRSGLVSTSRIPSNGSGPKRGSRKVHRETETSNRESRNAVAFDSRSSAKAVARASSCSNVLKSGYPSRQAPDTTRPQMPAPDTKYMEVSPAVVATHEKDEFSRILKTRMDELGMSGRTDFTSDTSSGKLTVTVLQELISALTNDMNMSASQSSNYSDASTPLSRNGNVGCTDPSGYVFSNDQSPDFQKCYKGEQDIDSSLTSLNNEPNQPSPTSVLEACFSNDTSSGSPVEKNEGKDLFVSRDNKMEDLFNLESDIVDLAMSIDTTKADAEEILHEGDKLSCLQTFLAHDFKILESRLQSIREAISNAELLLGIDLLPSTLSDLPLHPIMIEMLENSMDMFDGGEYSKLTEDKYQHTNFLFDCIVESLDSKFCNFGKCGYKAWLKLPLNLSKDLLKCQVLEDISNWRESSGTALRQVSDKEVDQATAKWDASRVEAFDISIAIENDILEALVGEFALDLW
ncbi:unnamed protein product [Urochloa humidicola]